MIFFIYLLLCSSQFAFSLPTWNSTAQPSTLWINRQSPIVVGWYDSTPILVRGNDTEGFLFGFHCDHAGTNCFLGILLFRNASISIDVGRTYSSRLVWSANRNHPVKLNATLQLGQDGNLVLADSDGTLVWSSNTTDESVSGLNLTERGNLVLFDKTNRIIWQSFDHPTDTLLPGQSLVSEQKLTASISEYYPNQGLISLTILNGRLAAYINSDPPQYYYTSILHNNGAYTAPTESSFMKIRSDGHLRVYRWAVFDWEGWYDIDLGVEKCRYPMVCGNYSICTNDGQCNCPVQGDFFRPISNILGCSRQIPISCKFSEYHSLIEVNKTTYFAFETKFNLGRSSMWLEGTTLEDCKTACLNNCSCKAAVWSGTLRENCLLLNEVFSLMDDHGGKNNMTVFLKVQNFSGGKQSRSFKVVIISTVAAVVVISLSIGTCFVVFKKRAGDYLLETILPGFLTRFSYNELKIVTQDFSKKLGQGGFGSVYEGTISNGTKIAVKRLDGVGHVIDSFLTEVKIVGSIHHVNLVKLIGFCAEESYRLLIYEYMVNGSLDRWISRENGLSWNTRLRIILDISKGLAYLHEDCRHKIFHLDIKPQNILLDQNFSAKISDFGLSKLLEKDKREIVTGMRGTPGYLAPEWLSSVITDKVDVYAFGIVLLEILCGRKNLDRSQADEEDVHLLSVFWRNAKQQQLVDMVDKNNEDMQLHKEEATEMMRLAAWCLQVESTKRPSMALVVKVLQGSAKAETDLDYNFSNLPAVATANQQRHSIISSKLPSVLSGPR